MRFRAAGAAVILGIATFVAAPVAADPHPAPVAEYVRSHNYNEPSMQGVRPSTYRGQAYSPAAERFRLCVIWRESKGMYGVHGSHLGAYQFSPRWQHGLPYMVTAELVRLDALAGHDRARVRRALQRLPIYRWSRFLQDTAFFVAYNHGAGFHHWHLAGSACDPLGRPW